MTHDYELSVDRGCRFTKVVMEDNPTSSLLDGKVVGIRFSMATRQEIVST
jgi:hypothetical protein